MTHDAERNQEALREQVALARASLPVPAPRPSWPAGLADVYAARTAPETLLGPPHVWSGVEFRRWRILHKAIHGHPFHPAPSLSRGDQWRAVHAHVDGLLGDVEILGWIDLQAEINDNRARGHHDWRPRKDDPCHDLLLEYVANRKRTALAIHHFDLAEKDGDPDSDWPVTPEMIDAWMARAER